MNINFPIFSLVVSLYNAILKVIEVGGRIGHWSERDPNVLNLRGKVERFQGNGFTPVERKEFWSWAKAQSPEGLFSLLLEVEVYDQESHPDYHEFYPWVHRHDSSWRVDSVGSKPAMGYSREYIVPYCGRIVTPTKYVEAKWEGGEWKY